MDNTSGNDSFADWRSNPDLVVNALNYVNSGIAILNHDGIFTYANRKYCDIYGFGIDNLLGSHFSILFPNEGIEEVTTRFNSLIGKEEVVSGESRLERMDGSMVDLQYTIEILKEGNIRHLVFTVNDISAIKSIKQELTDNEIRYRSMVKESAAKSEEVRKLIMNAALDAIICIDRNDKISLWNPQAERIFGWSSEDAVGRDLSEVIIPEKYRTMHKKGMQRYLETGQGPVLNILMELSAVNRQGGEFPIELTILPIKQDHEEEFFCAFIRDITERKKNESILKELNLQMGKNIEELAKSNIELEQFAYVASHDLQEPLRMVTNFLTQLNKKYNDQLDDKGKQYLNFAVDGAIRMRKIILDLLEYSRVGKLEMSWQQVDLNAIISETITLNKSLIEEHRAVIKAAKLPVIIANKTSIQQVFHNLIGNALKYQQDGSAPVIKINYSEDDDFWQFTVSDNGIGIEAYFFDKIFVLFQRLHNREEYSGTGIGLAICKKIVENHGGKIWVASEVGHGSTFYFTIKK